MRHQPEAEIRAVDNLLKDSVFIEKVIVNRTGSLINVSQENKIEIRTVLVSGTDQKIILDIGRRLFASISFIDQVCIFGSEDVEVPSVQNLLGKGYLGSEFIEVMRVISMGASAENEQRKK
jgi:hypothetical protein